MDNGKVRALVDEALEENKSLFLIDLFISAENKIKVTVDGDNGVPLSECIRISRNVEHNLDREEDDFSLEVTTPDISQPLSEKRQYIKNVGRILKVKTTKDEKFEGTLSFANENEIELHWKTREPKPIGKGKVTVEKTATISYKDIKEAKVKIVF
jgi:ribosome maturation factor RimP